MTKTAFVKLIILVLVLAIFTGCIIHLFNKVNEISNNFNLTEEQATNETEEESKVRFEALEKGKVDKYDYMIIEDTVTGVEYLVLENSNLLKLSITAISLSEEKEDVVLPAIP